MSHTVLFHFWFVIFVSYYSCIYVYIYIYSKLFLNVKKLNKDISREIFKTGLLQKSLKKKKKPTRNSQIR